MRFSEWSDNNAERFLQELQYAYSFLAERACGEIFLESPPGDNDAAILDLVK